jgi:hypothetical protein
VLLYISPSILCLFVCLSVCQCFSFFFHLSGNAKSIDQLTTICHPTVRGEEKRDFYLTFVYLSIYLSNCRSVYLSICLSICLFVCIIADLFICLSNCRSMYLFTCLPAFLFICQSVCMLFIYLYICLSTCLSICPSHYLFT